MIIKAILLVLASVSTLIFIVNLIKGKKYEYLVDNLDDSEYLMKDIYVVGFSLNETKLFALRGKLGRDLKKNSKLYFDNIYSEYYANVTWAQFLTFAFLLCSVGLSIASLFEGQATWMLLGIVALFLMALWNLCMSKMKEAVVKRREQCEKEFPNMVSKLSLLIGSGMVLRESWYLIANGKEGPLYELMKKACEYMDNGESEISAIHKFGVLSDSIEIKKFTSAMVQGIEKGNSELVDFLTSQASELWAHKRQVALQKGEIAAGKLIIPLGLMFAGIIMIIVVAAMQSMSF